MNTWWRLCNVFPGPLLRTAYGPVVEGRQHLPAAGAAIVVSNHLSLSDPVFLQLAVERQLVFVANVRFFQRKGIAGRLIRRLLTSLEVVPVDPAGGSSAYSLVDAACAAVAAGQLLCIYPEGGIARDGRLHRGKTGVGRVVAATGAPVVPVAMLNTDRVLPLTGRLPALQRARIRVGTPLDFSGMSASPTDRDAVRTITDDIMRELARLSRREYVDRYVHQRPAPTPGSGRARGRHRVGRARSGWWSEPW